MNEKKEEETERKAVEGSKTQTATQGNDDIKDRETPKAETETKKPSMIDGAVLAAEELKKQNDRKEELLKREEELEAKRILGGETEAGMKAPKPKPETDEEYASRVMAGDANPLGL